MKQRIKLIIAGTAVVGAAVGSTGVAMAGAGGDDSEAAISGDANDQAAAAALDYTGGGRVTDTEVGDEESYYEVEVTRDDGSQVDVQLDEGFTVVTSNPDEADDSD
jgi:hypothetical protein